MDAVFVEALHAGDRAPFTPSGRIGAAHTVTGERFRLRGEVVRVHARDNIYLARGLQDRGIKGATHEHDVLTPGAKRLDMRVSARLVQQHVAIGHGPDHAGMAARNRSARSAAHQSAAAL